MENNILLSFRQTIKHLIDIPDEKIDPFAELCTKKIYRRNDYFSTIEKPSTDLGYIAKGLIRLFVVDREGNEATLDFRGENSFTSSYGGIILNKLQPVYIQALEDSDIYVIERDEFVKLWDIDENWKNMLQIITEYDSLQLREREISFLQDDAKTRYVKFMKNFKTITDRIKNRYIASYLGISAETLSRIKSEIKYLETNKA